MDQRLGKRRARKKIYLFSDLESPLQKKDWQTLPDVVQQIKNQEIELAMVGLDFTHRPHDMMTMMIKEEGGNHGGSSKGNIKSENEKMMISVLEQVNGTYTDAMEFVDSLQFFAKSE